MLKRPLPFRAAATFVAVAMLCALLTPPLAFAVEQKNSSPPSSPDEVLKSSGLAKVGLFYLLDADAKLPDGLRAIRKAEAQLQAYAAKRRAIEADIDKAKNFAIQWEQE